MNDINAMMPILILAGYSLIVIAGKSLIELLRNNYSSYKSLIYGVFFGGVGSLTIIFPISYEPGFFMEIWLPFVALASAFGGPYSSIIAGIVEFVARGWVGGGGALSGQVAIVLTAILGYALRDKLVLLSKTRYFASLLAIVVLLSLFVVIGSLVSFGIDTTLNFYVVAGPIIFSTILVGTLILGLALRFIDQLLSSQSQLKLNQINMSVLFDRVRDVVLVVSQDGTIRRASQSCADSFGLDPDELVGTNLYHLLHPDDATYVKQRALENAPTQPNQSVRMRIKHKTGIWRDIETTRSSFFKEDGEYRYIATARDITDRLANDRALLEREVQLRSIIDNSPSPILIKDMDGKFILAGKSSEDYMLNAHQVIPGNTSEEVYTAGSQIIQQSLDSDNYIKKFGKTVKYETTYCNVLTGENHNFFVTKFPIKDENNQVHAIGIIATDITDLKKTEIHLRRTQKMEALGQFTGGVAHDFNNLLNVVIGSLEMLGDEDLAPEEFQHVLEMALNSATKGAELTKRLLAYSRKQVLSPTTLSPSDMITGLRPILKSLTGETITLNIATDPDDTNVNVDSSQLENAIINLVVNARDAINGDGKIDISITHTTVDHITVIGDTEIPKGPYVIIAVQDDGSGMTEEVLKEATSPFFTTKDVGKGSGLGLSMVHGFINQSGGGMLIESVAEQGTTIKLFIPIAKSVEQQAEEAQITNTFNKLKVLVVEDNDDLRKMALYTFQKLGFETVEASNGQDAVTRHDEHKDIDLLFTDIVMPGGVSGDALAKKLKKSNGKMKVLYTSGYPEMANTLQQELKKDEEFINKPYKQFALREKLNILFPPNS